MGIEGDYPNGLDKKEFCKDMDAISKKYNIAFMFLTYGILKEDGEELEISGHALNMEHNAREIFADYASSALNQIQKSYLNIKP